MRNRKCQELNNNADTAYIRCCSLIKKSNYFGEYVLAPEHSRVNLSHENNEYRGAIKPLTKRVYTNPTMCGY